MVGPPAGSPPASARRPAGSGERTPTNASESTSESVCQLGYTRPGTQLALKPCTTLDCGGAHTIRSGGEASPGSSSNDSATVALDARAPDQLTSVSGELASEV